MGGSCSCADDVIESVPSTPKSRSNAARAYVTDDHLVPDVPAVEDAVPPDSLPASAAAAATARTESSTSSTRSDVATAEAPSTGSNPRAPPNSTVDSDDGNEVRTPLSPLSTVSSSSSTTSKSLGSGRTGRAASRQGSDLPVAVGTNSPTAPPSPREALVQAHNGAPSDARAMHGGGLAEGYRRAVSNSSLDEWLEAGSGSGHSSSSFDVHARHAVSGRTSPVSREDTMTLTGENMLVGATTTAAAVPPDADASGDSDAVHAQRAHLRRSRRPRAQPAADHADADSDPSLESAPFFHAPRRDATMVFAEDGDAEGDSDKSWSTFRSSSGESSASSNSGSSNALSTQQPPAPEFSE